MDIYYRHNVEKRYLRTIHSKHYTYKSMKTDKTKFVAKVHIHSG